MRQVVLIRKREANDDQGVRGILTTDTGHIFCSQELPDRNNIKQKSCIPPGTYICRWLWSEEHQRNLFHLLNVPGRDQEEIHSANLAGDVDKGYVSQLLGCIALGSGVATFPANVPPAGKLAQQGVTNSHVAMEVFEQQMGTDDFELVIQWSDGKYL